MGGSAYEAELTYLVQYAQASPVYFVPVRDAAETVAGAGASEETIQLTTLELIRGMISQGIEVGSMSPVEGEGFTPWGLPPEESLKRVEVEMRKREDPLDFIDICWFGI